MDSKMADAEESSVVTLDLTTAPTLNALFQRLEETDVFNIVDTITFDTNARTVMFHLHKLLGQRAEGIHHSQSENEDSAEAKIRNLSNIYKCKYPELLEHFKEWQPIRKALIKRLGSSSDSLERNSSFVSGFRIFTSVVDIAGTLMRLTDINDYSIANLLMENASVCGILAITVEVILSKTIYADVNEAIKKDQECFERIVQWFKQSEELNRTIRSFFPYGIDKDLVKKIQASSTITADDYLSVAVATANVEKHVKLFKNKDFLDTSECFATSEAGKSRFRKVLRENDPLSIHTLNSTLCDEIQELVKVSPTEKPQLYSDACRLLTSTVRMKITLNTGIIIWSASNLRFRKSSEKHFTLEKLFKKTSEELDKVRNIVFLLTPSGTPVDPILLE